MKIRVFFLLIICLVFNNVAMLAQTSGIEELKGEVRSASGKDKAALLVRLSDAYFAAGNLKESANSAEEAEKTARKAGAKDIQAMALNRQAKVLERRGDTKKAWKRYEESNELVAKLPSGQQGIMADNLQAMKVLAPKVGKSAESVDAKASVITPGATNDAANYPQPLTRQELREELSGLQEEVSKNRHITTQLAQKEALLLSESQELRSQLAARQKDIDLMTEQQMKAALMVMQQRSLLDSLVYESVYDSLALSSANAALGEAQANRNFYLSALVAMLLLAGGSLFSFIRARQHAKALGQKNVIIREEQHRSEKLLLNILPALVADELKQRGRTEARYFEDVSVLFADFVGFSKIAEKLSPQQLVSELDSCFQAFDEIITKYKLEKIKTIGDAYMCAGGLPNGGGAQLQDMVSAALEMQLWLNSWNAERAAKGMPRYDARIGIHRGPVVAGVVGSRKFAFDIWGDTVNIAARIEQAGEGGKINISGEVHEIIKEYYPRTYRGKIAAKNKGEI
ncbi:MAG: adenylate/guanylate cyclase domain-containing protein, partial [Saprospiraceae bacterium]